MGKGVLTITISSDATIEILDVSQFLLTDYLLFYYIGFASNLTLAVLHCTDFTDAGMQGEVV